MTANGRSALSLISMVAVTAAVVGAPAQAAVCPGFDAAAYAESALSMAPDEWAVGRYTEIEVFLAQPAVGPITVSLGPTPGGRFSHPYLTVEPTVGGFVTVPLEFAAGDGPAVLGVQWAGPGGCQAGATKTIKPLSTSRPDVSEPIIENSKFKRDKQISFEFDVTNATPGRITVQVSGGGRTGSISTRTGDSFPDWSRREVYRTRGFSLFGNNDDETPSVTFQSWVARRTTYRMRYVLSFEGEVLGHGSFTVRVRHRPRRRGRPGTPDRRIWAGTDAFFNYCIKRNKELFSKGGRIYCWKPGRLGRPGARGYWYNTIRNVTFAAD